MNKIQNIKKNCFFFIYKNYKFIFFYFKIKMQNKVNFNMEKDNVFHFLKKVNTNLVVVVTDMKLDFEKNPNSNDIK